MQSRVGDHNTAHRHRRQTRDRRQRAGPADLDLDLFENCRGLLGGEFVGNCPTRGAGNKAQPLLPVEPVNLVDDPVDIIAQHCPLRLDIAIDGDQFIDAFTALHQWIDRKAPIAQAGDRPHLGRRQRRTDLAPGIGEKAQGALGGHGRIDLAQRAGSSIAWIFIGRFAGSFLALIEGREVVMRHVDFAAHFQHVGPAGPRQTLGNVFQSQKIGSHVLAGLPIATRGTVNDTPVLIADGGREAIDLGLGGDRDRFVFRQPQEAPHPPGEIRDVLVVECIAQ